MSYPASILSIISSIHERNTRLTLFRTTALLSILFPARKPNRELVRLLLDTLSIKLGVFKYFEFWSFCPAGSRYIFLSILEILYSQSRSSGGTSSFQHLLSSVGLHLHQKPVLSFPFNFFYLC